MAKLLKKLSKTVGHIPGDLVYVGEKKVEKVRISVIDYDGEQVQERSPQTSKRFSLSRRLLRLPG